MKLPFTKANNIKKPRSGYGFAFIDADDKKLKIKKHDSVIEFTNTLDDTQLLDLTNYIAFEVYANSEVIPVGENIELGGVVSEEIPIGMTHYTLIKTVAPSDEKCDVIIDWGDGSEYTVIANGESAYDYRDGDSAGYEYRCHHEYASTGKYIVKIYGKSIYNIQHREDFDDLTDEQNMNSSLICRVFDYDLPISNLKNLASFCRASQRLLKVSAETIKYYGIESLNGAFRECHNLLEAREFDRDFQACFCAECFKNCYNLKYSDMLLAFRTPYRSCSYIYENCYNLEVNFYSVVPEIWEGYNSYVLKGAFKNCRSMRGTMPDQRLWNNSIIKWESATDCFSGCNEDIRALVPISWGGTASNDIIEKSDSKKIVELESTIASLTERIAALENA